MSALSDYTRTNDACAVLTVSQSSSAMVLCLKVRIEEKQEKVGQVE
jgi:hypothetical protein